jgi:hypothetical protein
MRVRVGYARPTPTNSMEQNPSWETDSHPANHVISHLILEPEGSLPYSQDPAIGPYSEPDEPIPRPPTQFP